MFCFPKLKHSIFILMSIIITLQVIHFWMIGLIERRDRQERSVDDTTRLNKFIDDLQDMENKLHNTDIIDSSGVYRMFPIFFTTIPNNANYNLTLVTHSSTHNLLQLIELSKRWDGLTSVSVFTVYKQLLATLTIIAYLNTCVDTIRGRTDFHLVIPLTPHRFNYSLEYLSSFKLNCNSDKFAHSLNEVVQNYALDNGKPYPNNILRNFAIQQARTDYVLMVDIDILPSEFLHGRFSRFLKPSNLLNFPSETIYILPVFEIKSGIQMPKSKRDLITNLKNGHVRQFYIEICGKCHAPLKYSDWSMTIGSDENLGVMYTVPWKDPWEPYYIVKKPFPLYDERFKQYGFNRISQVCELHIAGYTMAVLDNAFLIHQGFKYHRQFHSMKYQEQERNRLLFRVFKDELTVKYPKSTNKC